MDISLCLPLLRVRLLASIQNPRPSSSEAPAKRARGFRTYMGSDSGWLEADLLAMQGDVTVSQGLEALSSVSPGILAQ